MIKMINKSPRHIEKLLYLAGILILTLIGKSVSAGEEQLSFDAFTAYDAPGVQGNRDFTDTNQPDTVDSFSGT